MLLLSTGELSHLLRCCTAERKAHSCPHGTNAETHIQTHTRSRTRQQPLWRAVEINLSLS